MKGVGMMRATFVSGKSSIIARYALLISFCILFQTIPASAQQACDALLDPVFVSEATFDDVFD